MERVDNYVYAPWKNIVQRDFICRKQTLGNNPNYNNNDNNKSNNNNRYKS